LWQRRKIITTRVVGKKRLRMLLSIDTGVNFVSTPICSQC
jgi:hypothetical protein